VRACPFSKGHISKKIPLGVAVTQYLGFAPLSLWESATRSLNLKYWALPANHIDMALPPAIRAYGPEGEKGRGLTQTQPSSFTKPHREQSLFKQSLTIPTAQLVGSEND
jgi:hypothetical protein